MQPSGLVLGPQRSLPGDLSGLEGKACTLQRTGGLQGGGGPGSLCGSPPPAARLWAALPGPPRGQALQTTPRALALEADQRESVHCSWWRTR